MKKITLVNPKDKNDKVTGDVRYIQSFLQVQSNSKGLSTYCLPEDSEYEFIDNGIIKRPNKTVSSKSATSGQDQSGDKASG